MEEDKHLKQFASALSNLNSQVGKGILNFINSEYESQESFEKRKAHHKQKTMESEIKVCSKCRNQLNDIWEQRACTINLEIGIDCCGSDALFGYNNNIGFKHSSIQAGSGEQNIKIKTGGESEYKLCIDCHKQFVRTIGQFIKNDSN